MQKIMYGLIAVAIVAGVVSFGLRQGEPPVAELEAQSMPTQLLSDEQMSLTFSGTQTLAERFERYAGALPERLLSIDEMITIAPPPHTPEAVAAELALLHEYESQRTPELLETIDYEVPVENFTLGAYHLGSLTDTKPLTAALIEKIYRDYDYLIFKYKIHFDRVRPSIIDPTLTTVIPVPDHPAYPSRHSSQTHLLAHILGYLDPANAATYFADAGRISENRERAGVHYPSDTAAGKSLAEQYFTLSLENEAFHEELERLKEVEWGG